MNWYSNKDLLKCSKKELIEYINSIREERVKDNCRHDKQIKDLRNEWYSQVNERNEAILKLINKL
jgi:hypothetical protein